ncbi:membrane lipoprotein lipid attachment site-containing protein [Deinococcus sp. KNUC1210]|uniref:membrane lipoprotein lipid attachment site-containing protein n=1 Tax=Deinococcus sp. KNUC1210 TaxID=2917691 RepID=UPI001EF0515E|nr:membrane lipoprotein lipid attachment site-containing protein [Deinococcus sp. KNUC1210]ULH15540.1 membrane lipoprotein lipid attachment site-containing protein [Deinococcus sp. KNUC1210]
MKKILILTVATVVLAACGPKVTPPVTVELRQTRDYTFAVAPTRTDVEVKPGHLGTKFCYTDAQPNSSEVCNNLTTGKRVVETGSTYNAQFTALEEGQAVAAK